MAQRKIYRQLGFTEIRRGRRKDKEKKKGKTRRKKEREKTRKKKNKQKKMMRKMNRRREPRNQRFVLGQPSLAGRAGQQQQQYVPEVRARRHPQPGTMQSAVHCCLTTLLCPPLLPFTAKYFIHLPGETN